MDADFGANDSPIKVLKGGPLHNGGSFAAGPLWLRPRGPESLRRHSRPMKERTAAEK